MREPCPDWSPLGVDFKILDEHPHLFYIRVPREWRSYALPEQRGISQVRKALRKALRLKGNIMWADSDVGKVIKRKQFLP